MGLIPVQALNFFRFLFVMPCLKKDKTGTSLSCLYIFFVVTGLNFFQVLFSTTSSVVFLAVRIYQICFFAAVQIYEFHISKIIISKVTFQFFLRVACAIFVSVSNFGFMQKILKTVSK